MVTDSTTTPFPVISLKSYLLKGNSTQDALQEVAGEFDNALSNYGAIYLVDHGIDPKLMNKVLTDLRTFFEMPVEKKKIYDLSEKHFGCTLWWWLHSATVNKTDEHVSDPPCSGGSRMLYKRFLLNPSSECFICLYGSSPKPFVFGHCCTFQWLHTAGWYQPRNSPFILRHGRGYIPFATQNASAFAGRYGKPNDLVERFYFGSTQPLIKDFVQKTDDFIESWAPNVYADCFRDSITKYFEAVNNLAHTILKIMSFAMGQPEDFLNNMCNRASPMMKANYYPVAKQVCEDQPRLAEHQDVLPVTITLMDDTRNGLQVKNVEGQWVYANPPPGSLLVYTGDCTAILTNNHWPPAPHLVPFPDCDQSKMKARISLPFFVQLNTHDELKTVPKFLDKDGKSSFEPTTYWNIIHHRMKSLIEEKATY